MASTFTGAQRPVAPAYGCTVILGEGPGEYTPLTLARGGKLENRFGAFQHADFVGVPYGSRVYARAAGARGGKGFVEGLRWSPELGTRALAHRTQILYFVDCAATAAQLGLRPGSVVVESGTGSGSLTVALARAVAPHGAVYTFDFNAGRAAAAAADVRALGLAPVVRAAQGDACAGFGPALDGAADAVFLDVPSPWDALPHAHAALKPANGAVCCFSPCIEQVQRTATRLRALGFEDIRTVEALARDFDVLAAAMPRAKDVRPYFAAGADAAAAAATADAGAAGDAAPAPAAAPPARTWAATRSGTGKRPRPADAAAAATAAAAEPPPPPAAALESAPAPAPAAEPPAPGGGLVPVPPFPAWAAAPLPLAVRQVGEGAAGHTGYLTFAMLYTKRLSSADAVAGKLLVEEDALGLIDRDAGDGGDGDGDDDDSGDDGGGAAGGELERI